MARPFFPGKEGVLLVTVLLSFVAVAVGVAADQFLKMLVLAHLKPVGSIELIPGFFQLTYVENRGAAFGILANHQWLFVTVTALVCLIMAGTLIWYKAHTNLTRTAVVLIMAGGLGNLIDRVRFHFVVDFLHFQFFPPVFNFADICVTVGCGLLILYVILYSDTGKPKGPKRYAKYAHYNRNRNYRMGG